MRERHIQHSTASVFAGVHSGMVWGAISVMGRACFYIHRYE